MTEQSSASMESEQLGQASNLRSLFVEVEQFPDLSQIEFGELFSLSLSNSTGYLTHGIHRFAAKYVPQIPKWAIQQFCSDNDTVLDPFMGSGTTLVEAALAGNRAVGIDIDALACLIAQVKTTPVPREQITRHFEVIDTALGLSSVELRAPMDDISNFEHWFSEKSWADLTILRNTIDELECSEEVRCFYLCVFSSILRFVSKADDQSQKTYVSGTLEKEEVDVRELFWKRAIKALDAISDYSALIGGNPKVDIRRRSAQDTGLEDEAVDLIVTSPPYLDSVDYMYNFMLEYFWLGKYFGIETRKAYNDLRRVPTGAKNPQQKISSLPASIEDLIDLESVPPYRRKAVPAYFWGMRKHFEEAARVLKKQGRYVLVVGNSSMEEGTIPVHDCLVRLAYEFGFSLENAFGYRIRRHHMKFPRKGRGGIILIDWVIVLRKSKENQAPRRLPIPKFFLGKDEVAN
ncbi:MAG: modification methylase [Alphaproteobacteria bacterium]|nr:MAG: modification methylase [Alphaproteobacteria bacterium]